MEKCMFDDEDMARLIHAGRDLDYFFLLEPEIVHIYFDDNKFSMNDMMSIMDESNQ